MVALLTIASSATIASIAGFNDNVAAFGKFVAEPTVVEMSGIDSVTAENTLQ